MPDVISDTNGKLCVGSYHMWRLLSNPDNYRDVLKRGGVSLYMFYISALKAVTL